MSYSIMLKFFVKTRQPDLSKARNTGTAMKVRNRNFRPRNFVIFSFFLFETLQRYETHQALLWGSGRFRGHGPGGGSQAGSPDL